MSSIRKKRVESLLLQELSNMLLRNEIKDPRISRAVCISRIETSVDLRYAKVYVGCYELTNSLGESIDALNHAAGFIQSSLGKKIRIRYIPRLTFILDQGLKDGFIMTQKLKELDIHESD